MTVLVLGGLGFLGACGEKPQRSASVLKDDTAKALTIAVPSAATLRRGGTAKIDVNIGRRNVFGEITVGFGDLPRGIDVMETDNRLFGDSGMFTLRASESASLVENAAAKVIVTAAGGLSATASFRVSVRDKETASGN